MRELPIPGFYQSGNAREWSYAPDQHALFLAARAWRKEHGLRPAAADRKKVHLVLVDVQKDFCFPRGTLYVGGRSGTGAMDDSDRIARFIYRNLENLSDVTCTLDTHFPFQIFSPSFWLDENSEPPATHQEITTEDIRAGRMRPNPDLVSWVEPEIDEAWLAKQVESYCAKLEKTGKYKLYLWPPHCLLGSDGHPLAGVIHEARLFHAWSRGARGGIEIKGDHPLTENYSVLAPEVLFTWDGRQIALRNSRFIETLVTADALIIAGQAASHCVKSTLDDLLVEIAARDPELARKVYVLRDCMSAVAVPDPERPGEFVFDFTPQAEQALWTCPVLVDGLRVGFSTLLRGAGGQSPPVRLPGTTDTRVKDKWWELPRDSQPVKLEFAFLLRLFIALLTPTRKAQSRPTSLAHVTRPAPVVRIPSGSGSPGPNDADEGCTSPRETRRRPCGPRPACGTGGAPKARIPR